MVRMVALRPWRGSEGRVSRGDEVDVTESRARELEGFDQRTARRLSAQYGQGDAQSMPIHTRPRARRVETIEGKGGPTAADSGGWERPPATGAAEREADALDVDFADVTPTGNGGKVTVQDVRDVHAQRGGDDA